MTRACRREATPSGGSGHYSQDPVYAEIIREALRLGFRLVAYDSNLGNSSVPLREQNEAENLACVFKQDPKARMVVLAGFSHIAEGKDFWVPGGAMAYRFRELSGIDPLTVDSTTQLALDPATLRFVPAQSAAAFGPFLLGNAAGTPYRTDNFDLLLYVPAPAHRSDGQPSWLALSDARRPTPFTATKCAAKDLCLVEARRVGEVAQAIAADRCIVAKPETGCTLYLAPGEFEISTQDPDGQRLSTQRVEVAR